MKNKFLDKKTKKYMKKEKFFKQNMDFWKNNS